MRLRGSLTVSLWLTLAVAGGAVAYAQAEPESNAPLMAGLNAAAFPTSDDVVRQYRTDQERLAALAVLLDLLQFKMDDRSPLGIERQTDYRRAITRLDPPRATDDQRAAARNLRRDVSFQSAVVTKFLPAYAPQAAKAAALPRAVANDGGFDALWTAFAAAIAAALLVPIIVVVRSRR